VFGYSKIDWGTALTEKNEEFEYFCRLRNILLPGLLNKRWLVAPVLKRCAAKFGQRILEVGSGTGSGILGAYPDKVTGIDINRHAVEYCLERRYKACLIKPTELFPFADGFFDVCVLDNVIEHIADSKHTIDECLRVTKTRGGLILVVPGKKGFDSDSDHKKFYGQNELAVLDQRIILTKLFSLPIFFKSNFIASVFASYCLVAVYRKKS